MGQTRDQIARQVDYYYCCYNGLGQHDMGYAWDVRGEGSNVMIGFPLRGKFNPTPLDNNNNTTS